MASSAASAAAAAAVKRSAAAAAAASSSATVTSSSTSASASALKWAAGGWSLFIAENLLLSENRTYLIDRLGDEGYHGLYGTLSTVAMGSVAYAYRYKVRGQGPFAFSGRPAPAALAASFALQALALGMVSQSAPKLQIPVHLVNDSSSGGAAAAADAKNNNAATTTQVKAAPAPAPAPAAGGSRWKVRCPFDFSDSKSQTGVPKGTQQQADQLAGLDRITRHPGLWSFGLLGLGNALLVPSIPTRIWLSMPAMVALIGGTHTDLRHRRGMGGELCREVDDVTSNVPFLAMIMGRQDGGVVQSFEALGDEVKVLNAALAAGGAALWVARRGRGGAIRPVVR